MDLAYRNAILHYAHDRVTLRRGSRNERIPLEPKLIRLLRRRAIRPAVLAALAEDHLGDPSLGPLLIYADKTYTGCRDRVYRIAIEWNRRVRPFFVPRPRPVPMTEAFGGQGAFTPLLDCGLTIYFTKACHGRLRLTRNDRTLDIPLLPDALLAVRITGLFLLEHSDELAECCSAAQLARCERLRESAGGAAHGEAGSPARGAT